MNEKVRELLEEKVNDIFLEMQNELNITSGDISPSMAFDLDEEMDNLANIITQILKEQK